MHQRSTQALAIGSIQFVPRSGEEMAGKTIRTGVVVPCAKRSRPYPAMGNLSFSRMIRAGAMLSPAGRSRRATGSGKKASRSRSCRRIGIQCRARNITRKRTMNWAPSLRSAPAPSRRRRFGFFPFSARRPAPRRPEASDATRPAANAAQADPIETPTVPVKSKRAPRARRRLVALSFATVVVAALVATSFRTDVVAYLKQYAGRQDVVRTGTPDVPVTSYAVQAADSATAELRQSLQQERGKAEALTQSLATAQREIDKHTALASKAGDDAAQIKRAAESTTAELRQSLQQERGKAEALAQSLATAQREIDKHTALASKAGDDAAQIKRAAESTTAELRQSLQQERGKAEALAQSLATAQREIDKHTALATKAGDDAAQIKRAAESTAAELRQSLQQERDRAEALAQTLATSAPRDRQVRSAGKQGGRRRSKDQAGPGKHHGGVATVLATGARQGRGAGTDLATARREIDKYASAGKQGGRRRGTNEAGCRKRHRGVATIPAAGARQGRGAGTDPRKSAPRDRHVRSAGEARRATMRGTDQGRGKHHGGVATVPATGARQGRGAGARS